MHENKTRAGCLTVEGPTHMPDIIRAWFINVMMWHLNNMGNSVSSTLNIVSRFWLLESLLHNDACFEQVVYRLCTPIEVVIFFKLIPLEWLLMWAACEPYTICWVSATNAYSSLINYPSWHVQGVIMETGLYPTLNGPEFAWFWWVPLESKRGLTYIYVCTQHWNVWIFPKYLCWCVVSVFRIPG